MVATISPEYLIQIITGLMKELHPEDAAHREVTLDSQLDRDLGLDSLARMELLTRIEQRFSIRLPDKVLAEVETPRDLLRFLDKGRNGRLATVPTARGAVHADRTAGGKRRTVSFEHAETLLDVLENHVELHPHAEHITLLEDEEERVISYGKLQAKALQVATLLQSYQVESGATVAIMLPTGEDYFYTFMGIMYCGAVPVPLYPPARPNQIEEHVRRHRKILTNAGSSILITVPEVRSVARLLKSQVGCLRRIVTTGELYREVGKPSPVVFHSKDTAFLQYTSGSTGDPKGVILTHKNLLANIRAMGRVCKVTSEDVFVSWLPLYHDMGLIGAWFGSLCHGCRLVIMSPLAFLARPERWLQAIHKYGGTLSASPNFGYEICATRLEDSDIEGIRLDNWRMAFNGAEPVLPETLRRFQERFLSYGFRPEALAPVYGLAEASVGLAFPDPGSGVIIDRVKRDVFSDTGKAETGQGEEPVLEFVGCGHVLPAHQIRIVDEQDRELPDRYEGRLQFSGESSTSGYYKNPEETRKLFNGNWLETGDRAYIADGELFLTSRQKDIIIKAGRNIYPHELEEVVSTIPGIRKGCTAVFGARTGKSRTEQLVILTETRKTDPVELQDLKKQVQSITVDVLGMGADDIVIAGPGTVLKTSSGKIRRSSCRELYESGHIGKKKSAVWLQLLRISLKSVRPLGLRMVHRLDSAGYAGWCWLIFGLTGIVAWTGVMLLPRFRQRWQFVHTLVRTVCRLTGISVKVEGIDEFLNRNVGNCVFVCNHMSYLDSIILAAVLPEPCHFVGKAELAKYWFLRVALEKFGVFLVDRFHAEQSLEDTKKIGIALHEGQRPLFFAEGTLHRMPGLLPFQMGAFVLACNETVPVVPVILQGTRNILRGGSWFPRRGKVTVTIAPQCEPKGKEWKAAVELRDRVRDEMLKRSGEPDLSGEFTSLLQMDKHRHHAKKEDG